MNRRMHTIAILLVPLTLACQAIPPAYAETPPQSLLDIMRQLEADTLRLTSALIVQDWPAAATSATAIAEHPKVPMGERARILSAIGTRAADFRKLDGDVHDAATALAEAAAQGEPARARAAYGEMLDGCISCHQQFRSRVQALRTEGDGAAAGDG